MRRYGARLDRDGQMAMKYVQPSFYFNFPVPIDLRNQKQMFNIRILNAFLQKKFLKRQRQGKVKARFRQGKSKVKERSRQGQQQ